MKIQIKCQNPKCKRKRVDIDIGNGLNYIDIDTIAEREGYKLLRLSDTEICFAACSQDCVEEIIKIIEAIYD